MRRQLGRLDHHPVAGGDRADRGRQRQLQRIIPGRDDADHPERLRDQAVLARHELQRGVDALRRHPFLQVLGGVLDLDIEEQRLGDGGLDGGAMAEIGRDRLLEAGLVLLDRGAQPAQPVDPDVAARQGIGPRGVELGMEGVVEGGKGRILGSEGFQGLVHGISPFLAFSLPLPARGERPDRIARCDPGEGGLSTKSNLTVSPKLPLCARFGKSARFRARLPNLLCHKNEKTGPKTLSKADRRWYIPPAPAGFSPRGAFSGSPLERKIGAAAALAHPRFAKRLSLKGRNGLSRGGAAR